MQKPQVVVLGFGDTGLLVSLGLAERFAVTVVAPRTFYLSSQNVGGRLAWPATWERVSKIDAGRFAKLEGVRLVQGLTLGIDAAAKTATFRTPNDEVETLPYDALVIATGADNGFWRRTYLETAEDEALRRVDEQATLAGVSEVTIVGGGASAVSMAGSLAERYPGKSIHLYYPGPRLLSRFPARASETMTNHLRQLGVMLHPGHRAELEGPGDAMKAGVVTWSTGQPPLESPLVLWAVGRPRPNSDFLPPEMLDSEGFVRVRPTLQVESDDSVFCVGDVAASDPLRSSARNGGAQIVVENIKRHLGRPSRALRTFEAPQKKWGELMTSPHSGMMLFTPGGRRIRLAPWLVRRVIFDWIVFRLMYGGVRRKDMSS